MMQEMTYEERELLKSFDFQGQEREVLVMIAHWHRQNIRIPFSDYAANWAAASPAHEVSRLRVAWPLKGERMIADGCSEWGTFGKDWRRHS